MVIYQIHQINFSWIDKNCVIEMCRHDKNINIITNCMQYRRSFKTHKFAYGPKSGEWWQVDLSE